MKATEVLDVLTTRVPQLLEEKYRADRCIISTRVAVEVLRRLDVPCHAQAFAVEILNEPAVRATLEGWLADTTRVFVEKAKIISVEGSGFIDEKGGWDGHLAVVIDVPVPILVDLSAGQFTRPTRGIHVEPFWVTAPEWPLFLEDPRGCVAQYRPVPTRTYRNSGDWRTRERWAPVVETILDFLGSSPLDPVTPPG